MRTAFTPKKRQAILRTLFVKFGRVCWYCGSDLSFQQIHIDHIVPQKNGGDDDISNLALTCKCCNVAKNFQLLDVFFQWIDFVRSDKFKRIYDPREVHPHSHLRVIENR